MLTVIITMWMIKWNIDWTEVMIIELGTEVITNGKDII